MSLAGSDTLDETLEIGELMSNEKDREALEQGIRAAVTDAMSHLTREEIHELVMEPYQALKEKNR